MSATQEKLGEARFFLEKARVEAQDAGCLITAFECGPPTPLKHYLSAFVSAARSVTWVMRHEYGRESGWTEWFQGRTPADSEGLLLRQANAARISTVKRATLTVSPHMFGIAESLLKEMSAETLERVQTLGIRCSLQPVDPSGARKSNKQTYAWVEEWHWSIEEFGEGDCLLACIQYLDALDRLVNECENRFPLANK